MSEQLEPGEESATRRSVLIGVGSVLLVTVAVAVFFPKVLRRPPPPLPAVAAQPSPSQAQEQISAAPPEAPAETPPPAASHSAFASSEGASQAADAAGEAAAAPEPPPQPHPVRPARQIKKVVAHRAPPAPPPQPEIDSIGAGATGVPVASTEPEPEPPLPPLSVVIGVRRTQAGLISKGVSLADLNLATPEGACKAMKRIRKAADDVCPFSVGNESMFEQRKCVQEAIKNTLDNMHRAKVDYLSDKKAVGGC